MLHTTTKAEATIVSPTILLELSFEEADGVSSAVLLMYLHILTLGYHRVKVNAHPKITNGDFNVRMDLRNMFCIMDEL